MAPDAAARAAAIAPTLLNPKPSYEADNRVKQCFNVNRLNGVIGDHFGGQSQ
jgi:hypothetical protein